VLGGGASLWKGRSEGEAANLEGARLEEHIGSGLEGAAGGQDVVDESDTDAGVELPIALEGPAHIFPADRPGEGRLGRGIARPFEAVPLPFDLEALG
jgi:hypothetical protein